MPTNIFKESCTSLQKSTIRYYKCIFTLVCKLKWYVNQSFQWKLYFSTKIFEYKNAYLHIAFSESSFVDSIVEATKFGNLDFVDWVKSVNVDSGDKKIVDDACDNPALVKVAVVVAVEVFSEVIRVVVLGLGSAVGVVAIDVVAEAPHTTLTLLPLTPENHTIQVL